MATLKKVLITPFFGPLPPWMDKFKVPEGYGWILDTDIEGFKKRVKDKLNIEYPGLPGTGKVWDYRCTLGLLYSDEIKEYDFWGHCDFDVVFGDVNKWVTDDLLSGLDVFSNHHSYVNGCFSLYRNTFMVNALFFQDFSNWRHNLMTPEVTGWVEESYSRTLEQSGLRYKYTFWQGWPYTTVPQLHESSGRLFQDGEEIMMFHFRRSKKWPL